MEKILVIEDSKLMRQKIVDILEKMGCENIIQLNNADVIYNNPKFYMKD
ncbi:MAG: phosphoserine phosphatase RsbU/P, partial [Thermosediminibacterales bacterium]|nr:phosphoserine phosphatase RsbU/P [Thermosediminibacterales bacterium]